MLLWTDKDIIHLKNYKGEYLNKTASKRFYSVYEDIISKESNNSYISLEEAQDICNNNPRDIEIYSIIKRNKPITTSGTNKIKCTMLMGVGIMCYLTMTKINKKDSDTVNDNLTKTFNHYIEDNPEFNAITKKVPNFTKFFRNIK